MEPFEAYKPYTPTQDKDPTLPFFDAFLPKNPITAQLTNPKIHRSTWCTPSPLPVNHCFLLETKVDLRKRPDKLMQHPYTQNIETIILTNASHTTQEKTTSIHSQQRTFSTPVSLYLFIGCAKSPINLCTSNIQSFCMYRHHCICNFCNSVKQYKYIV